MVWKPDQKSVVRCYVIQKFTFTSKWSETVQTLLNKIKVNTINKNSQQGFTLIEMSMVIIIAGIITSTMMTVLPTILKSGKIKEARAKLVKYDYALRGYAIANFRLPYADTNGDGREDTGVFIGTLPFLTLGLTNGNDVWGRPVKYGVFPDLAKSPDPDPDPAKECTQREFFCSKLSEFSTNPKLNSSVHVDIAGVPLNQAYAISSGGPKNMDDDTYIDNAGKVQVNFFDFDTDPIGPKFNADDKIQALDYDDLVRYFSFNELLNQQKKHCEDCPKFSDPSDPSCPSCPYPYPFE